jgi:hypothetical protein
MPKSTAGTPRKAASAAPRKAASAAPPPPPPPPPPATPPGPTTPPGPNTAPAHNPQVDALIDQWAKVASHYVSVQSALAKNILGAWSGNGLWNAPVGGGDAFVSWVDGLGDVAQGWFTFVQLLDVLAGSGWGTTPPSGTSPKAGVYADTFTVPGSQDADLRISSLDDGDGHVITTGISIAPTRITANVRDVTVTVAPPAGTPRGNYLVGIVDAKSGASIFSPTMYLSAT